MVQQEEVSVHLSMNVESFNLEKESACKAEKIFIQRGQSLQFMQKLQYRTGAGNLK